MAFAFNPITGKLDLVGSGAAQVPSDWNATSGLAQILNKPTIPSPTTDASLLTSGTLADARLSSNVSLDNINNNFTVGQSITAPANTSALTASYSVTGANTTALVDLSGTWNTTGAARGILLNITDTASSAGSLLADFRVGGTSRFSVTKSGGLYGGIIGQTGVVTPATSGGIYVRALTSENGFSIYSSAANAVAAGPTGRIAHFDNTRLVVQDSGFLGFWSGSGDAYSNSDTILRRDSPGTLAQRNGTNAQTFRLYGTFTDASNGRRLDITSTTAGIFTLTATGNGTGASGNLLKLTAPILIPAASVTLATNGDLAFEATSNTTLTIRYRGTDGTTRSASLTLA